MSSLLSTTSLVGPLVPDWLEETCKRLTDNDPTYVTVDLTHPRIDDVLAKYLAKALQENHVVTTLILSCYALVDDGAMALGSVLGCNRRLQLLQLKDLRDAREITTFFSLMSSSSLTEVSLRHCLLCPRGAKAIANFLKHHPTLLEFRMTDSQLTGNALEIICDGVKESKSLQRVYFVSDDIDGSESASSIANMLRGSSIRELYLGGNSLENDGVEILTRAIINHNSSLRHLDLRSNNISQAGALALQGLLVNSRFLVSLCVSDNALGNLGTTALARGLQHTFCQTKKIDLSSTEVGPTGAKAIACMLRVNKVLEDLNLSFNAIGDDGASAIATALQSSNSTLKVLALRRNAISDIGAKYIAEKLPRMRGLKELSLTKNAIGPVGLTRLLVGLRSNMELQYLSVEEIVTEPLGREIVHWIRLNKAGRRIFCKTNSVPRPLWSHVYGRISNDSDAKPEVLPGQDNDETEDQIEPRDPSMSPMRKKKRAGNCIS